MGSKLDVTDPRLDRFLAFNGLELIVIDRATRRDLLRELVAVALRIRGSHLSVKFGLGERRVLRAAF
jgi:hypothetical protein